MNDFIHQILVRDELSLRSVLVPLDLSGLGFLIVVDVDDRCCGIVTDGDIRRALIRGVSLDESIKLVMKTDYVSLPISASAFEINQALRGTISFVPLLDEEGRPVDYARLSRHRRLPVMEPLLDGNELDYVQECVRTGWISSQGRFVGLFEDMMAKYHDVPYALAVSNGTVALHLAIVSLGIGPGDEVVVPDFTFAATVNAVLHAGATPVFVDIDPETWTIDPAHFERVLTKRTRAVIPVHIYGHPCAMEDIMALSNAKKLFVIEDCAEALGALYKGRLVGRFGDAACFSFFGNKILTTGEGGMVLFRDRSVYERAKMLRDHGMSKERRYWHLEVGYNYRMTNLQAAIGVAQMERVESILDKKRRVADFYNKALNKMREILLPPRASWAEPVNWLYTICLTGDIGLSRDEVAGRLVLNGIETRPVFYPLHIMPPYRQYCHGEQFPVTEHISSIGLSLPSSVTLQESNINIVAKNIKSMIEVRKMALAAGMGEENYEKA
jgi:perosamine synthetase